MSGRAAFRRTFDDDDDDDDEEDEVDYKPRGRRGLIRDTPLVEPEATVVVATDEGSVEETTVATSFDKDDNQENSTTQNYIILVIEGVRALAVTVGVIMGLFGRDIAVYRAATSLMVFAFSFLNAVELLFIGKIEARAKKWPTNSPYQKQCGLNDLANTAAMVVILLLQAVDGALATILVATSSSIILNGCLHMYSFLKDRLSGKPSPFIHLVRFGSSVLLAVAVAEIVSDWRAFPGRSIAPSTAPSWYRADEIEEFWTIDSF